MQELTPDCKNCAALCCVALAFDKGRMFAFDKPAGVACKHLNGALCDIHDRLAQAGLKGCAQYQCDGAGQRVVQEVFGGETWQDDPALLAPMLAAFAQMRQVHGSLALLDAARSLPLSPEKRAVLEALAGQLSPPHWSRESLAEFESSALPQTVRRFLRSLADFVPGQGRPL